jgi:hypothetical protein
MDADYSHRNILIQGHIPKLLFQAKIVQGSDASKRRVKSPSHAAFEQKEKELTGLVHSFLWLSKTFQQALLDVPVEERERASSSLLASDIPKRWSQS